MIQARFIFAGMLSLLLALTGVGRVEADGAPDAAGQMVICVGDSTVAIYVDAEGAPTVAPHFCPDCLAQSAVAILPFVDRLAIERVARRVTWYLDGYVSAAVLMMPAVARGPPVSV